jgi:hypothetical protein
MSDATGCLNMWWSARVRSEEIYWDHEGCSHVSELHAVEFGGWRGASRRAWDGCLGAAIATSVENNLKIDSAKCTYM